MLQHSLLHWEPILVQTDFLAFIDRSKSIIYSKHFVIVGVAVGGGILQQLDHDEL